MEQAAGKEPEPPAGEAVEAQPVAYVFVKRII